MPPTVPPFLHPRHTRTGVASEFCNVRRTAETRLAVALYGLFRDIRSTHPFLDANLFAVLRRSVGTFDIFVHSMQPAGGSDRGTPVDSLAALKINACRLALANQTAVDEEYNFVQRAHRDFVSRPLLRTRAGRVHFNMGDLLNLRRALYSLQAAEALITFHEHRSAFEYSVVIVARPDTAIVSPLPFAPLVGGGIRVPNFDHWGGVNDRFAYGDRESMTAYMRRFAAIQASGTMRAFNSEQLLCDVLRVARVPVGVVPLCVVRVRADGSAVLHDETAHRAGVPRNCLVPQQVLRTSHDRLNTCRHGS